MTCAIRILIRLLLALALLAPPWLGHPPKLGFSTPAIAKAVASPAVASEHAPHPPAAGHPHAHAIDVAACLMACACVLAATLATLTWTPARGTRLMPGPGPVSLPALNAGLERPPRHSA